MAEPIGAVGLRQRIVVLRDEAGERRGQIIAQRQPLLVVVLEGEDAFVGAVLIRQELAERVGIFDRRRLQRLEAVEFIDLADGFEHAPRGRKLGLSAVLKSARQPRLGFGGLRGNGGVFGHFGPLARRSFSWAGPP